MNAAGLLDYPLDSRGFMRWDTSYTDDGDRTGPGWSEEKRGSGGFRMRHPLGLFSTEPL